MASGLRRPFTQERKGSLGCASVALSEHVDPRRSSCFENCRAAVRCDTSEHSRWCGSLGRNDSQTNRTGTAGAADPVGIRVCGNTRHREPAACCRGSLRRRGRVYITRLRGTSLGVAPAPSSACACRSQEVATSATDRLCGARVPGSRHPRSNMAQWHPRDDS